VADGAADREAPPAGPGCGPYAICIQQM